MNRLSEAGTLYLSESGFILPYKTILLISYCQNAAVTIQTCVAHGSQVNTTWHAYQVIMDPQMGMAHTGMNSF